MDGALNAVPNAVPNAASNTAPGAAAARAATLAGCLLLGGCAGPLAPPAERLEPATPAGWFALSQRSQTAAPAATQAQRAADATPLARWWERFQDAPLTALVLQALQRNTSVQSAQAALLQARAQRDVQSAALGPALSGSASAQRSNGSGSGTSSRFQAGFDASWEPDLFGGNRATLSAGEAELRAAGTSLADVRVSLAAEVAVNYLELRSLQARLEIARRNLALQEETLQITRWRQQAGLVSALDVEQALAASEQTRAQLPTLQSSQAQTLNALAVLTGQAPGALQASLGPVAAPPVAPADLALAFPADTLRQRPDVRTAEHRVSASLARLSAADAARYPSLRLSGSLGLSALTLGGLADGASVLRSLLAGLSAPLFDGGAARAQVRAQSAALEQARLAYQSTVLTALQEVEDALVALQGNRERLARLQAAASAASQAEQLARLRYQSGLIDFRAVLDAQRSLLSAQDSVASTQASLGADHVRLYKALGGGWNPTDVETAATPTPTAEHTAAGSATPTATQTAR